MPNGRPHRSDRDTAKRTALPKQRACACAQALAAVLARVDQLQAQVDQQKWQQHEDDQDRQRDNLVLIGEVSAMRRVITDAGLELPAPAVQDDLCTVQQYGRRYNLSTEAVLSRIHRGTLDADKYGGPRWLIKDARFARLDRAAGCVA
jgi:hypothetical protein